MSVGLAFNGLLVLLIFIFTNFNVWFQVYIPKVMNYPFLSTAFTCGLYYTCIIQQNYIFRWPLCVFSAIAFITNALYLNEMVALSVPILSRFDGNYAYSIVSTPKHMQIYSHNNTSIDASMGFYTLGIVLVSYAMIVNLAHFFCSLAWIISGHTKNPNGKKKADKFWYGGSDLTSSPIHLSACILSFFILTFAAIQSCISIAAVAGGVIIPSLYVDAYPFLVIMAFWTISSPPVAAEPPAVPLNQHTSSHHHTKAPEKFLVITVEYVLFLTCVIFVTFISFVTFGLEMSWKTYNDLAAYCEHDGDKFYGPELGYYELNNTHSKQTVRYELLLNSNATLTMTYYCMDNIFSLFMVLFMFGIMILHMVLLGVKDNAGHLRYGSKRAYDLVIT